MGNAYFAYVHLVDYQAWVELFGLVDSEIIEQKRILSIVSGAILPLVALGFIKSLVDYIKPDEGETEEVNTVHDTIHDTVHDQITDAVTQVNEPVIEEPVVEVVEPELEKKKL